MTGVVGVVPGAEVDCAGADEARMVLKTGPFPSVAAAGAGMVGVVLLAALLLEEEPFIGAPLQSSGACLFPRVPLLAGNGTA